MAALLISVPLLVLQVLDRFLAAKAKVDSGSGVEQEEAENQCIDALHALTSVRALLTSGLQSGASKESLRALSLAGIVYLCA